MTRRFWLTFALGSTTGAGGIGAASITGATAGAELAGADEHPHAGASQPKAASMDSSVR